MADDDGGWEARTAARGCNDCGARAGSPHKGGCDVARCMVTGQQRIQCAGQECPTCGHGDHEEPCGEDIWTGEWPGLAECREFGWWSVFVPYGNPSWRRVPAGTPGATEDLNRLVVEARWDRETRRWVRG